jgi:hypothetical protein
MNDQLQSDRRRFWGEAFCTIFKSVGINTSVEYADKALEQFDKRFPEIQEEVRYGCINCNPYNEVKE